MTSSNTFCVLPHVGINVHVDGGLTPCCYFDRDPSKITHKFQDYAYWRRETLTGLKHNLDNGIRDERCQRCWQLEDNGVMSHRQRWNKTYADVIQQDLKPLESLRLLHLDFDNYCNLRCIMCHPKVSSSIESEYRANADRYHAFIKPYRAEPGPWHGNDQFEVFLSEIDQVDTLILTGGEPLINPTVIRLLNKLNLERCHVIVTTNASVIKPKVYDLLARALTSTITVSLEGIGVHNDYLRYGSDWSSVESNIEWLARLPNWRWVPMNINHTLQASSAWALPALLDWCIEKKHVFNINILTWPPYLSVKSLSDQRRQGLIDQLQDRLQAVADTWGAQSQQRHWVTNAIMELQQARHDPALEKQFFEYLQMLDSIRGTDFHKTFACMDGTA